MPQRIHNSALLFPTASEHRFCILHYPVREVVPYINWIYYFHAWGMEPRFAAVADIHDCPSCRASWIASFPTAEQPKAREAAKLYDEAKQLLRQWADEPICHALFLLAEAYSEGDDIIVDNRIRIPFLRQQHVGRSGYTLCLSDFIREKEEGCQAAPKERKEPDIASTMGVFATTVSLPPEKLSTLLFPSASDRWFNFQLSTLSDRLAEATAEKMHEEVRKHYWGYAKEEQLTIRELHNEQFQGIRPAVGYPSLPDQSINFILDELLNLSQIGITLSENGAMSPHCSVSGLIFAHPKASYFSVGNISEEQLRDYANRRNIDYHQAKKFLATILRN